jgi:hypothetical protein
MRLAAKAGPTSAAWNGRQAVPGCFFGKYFYVFRSIICF